MKILLSFLMLLLAQGLFAGPSQEFTYTDAALKKTGKYTLSNPDPSSRPKKPGLLVYFHGSGATNTYASNFSSLDDVARKLGLLAMAVQAPNGSDTWANAATGKSNQHDLYVRNLLDKVFPTLQGLDKNKILFVGISAGSTFLSGDFLPRFLTRYKGGAVLLCGGGGPVVMEESLFKRLSAKEASAMPLSYYIQKADFLYGQTMQGIFYWRQRQAKVAYETPEGGSHCGFDLIKELERLGKTVLAR